MMLLKKTLSVLTALLLLVSSPEALVNIHAEGENAGDGTITETNTGNGEGTNTGNITDSQEGTGEGVNTGDTTGGPGEIAGGGTNTGDSTDGTGDGTNTGDNTGGSEGSGDGAVTGDTTGGSEGTVTPAEGGETSTDKTGGGSQETGDLSDTEKQEEKKEGQENEEGNTEDSKENENETKADVNTNVVDPVLLEQTPSNYVDDNRTNVYIVKDDSLLDEDRGETDTDKYFDNGTYTNQKLLEEGDYYVRKQFEWTDKTKGEGKITFKTKFTKEPTVAVYAFTPCEGHGFLKQYAQQNIEYLLRNYDRVDLIWITAEDSTINGTNLPGWHYGYNDIHYQLDVGSDTDTDGTADYLNILNPTGAWTQNGMGDKYWSKTAGGKDGTHFGINLYTGLYAYLSGKQATDELFVNNQAATLTVDQLVNQPTAIYISFDGLLDTRTLPSGLPQVRTDGVEDINSNYMWIYPRIEYDCWGILRAYRNKGSYFSLGTSGNGEKGLYDKSFCFVFGGNGVMDNNLTTVNNNSYSLHYVLWNELVALANPAYMVDTNKDGIVDKNDIPSDKFWNGETRTADYTKYVGYYSLFFKDNTKTQFAYEFDYRYDANFADLDIPVVGITLDDTLADYFTVNGDVDSIEVEINYPGEPPAEVTRVNPTINGNNVSFSVINYHRGTELIFTIPVKLDDQKVVDVNQWTETNGGAELTINLGDYGKPEYDISSPKAHIEGYNITTEVIGGTITPSGGIREGGTREISYAPNSSENSYYELDYIEVDGKKLEGKEFDDSLQSYTFSNVTEDHKIKVVYKEYFDLTGTKTWNDGGIEHNNAEDIVITLTRTYNDGTSHTETLDSAEYPVTWENNQYTISKLPVYQDEGRNYQYSYKVAETLTDAAKAKLAAKYEGAQYAAPVINGFNITNNLKQEIETIDIPVTKTWVDGNNADHTRPDSIDVYLYVNGEKDETRKLTLTAPEDNPGADVWTGVFEHLPKFDSDGKEISYEVKEVTVDGYTSVVERGESISGYDYPENISDVAIDTSTKTTDSVTVTNGYDWEIQPGLRSDEIAGTKVVFNNNNMNVINTPFTEYDAKGNLVPTNERFFSIGSYYGREYIMYNPSKDPDNKNKTSIGSLIEISHYLEFRFEDAVTILDGTANGTTADVIMTVNNISVVRTNTSNSTQQRILSMLLGSVWAQSGGIGANSMDINFKVSGVNEGTVLLSFADIDVTDSPFTDRRETVYLMDGFDHTVYALPLGNSTSTDHKESNAEQRTIKGTSSTQKGPFTEFRVIESEGTPIFRARALRQDGSLGDSNGTLQSGFVARANLSENGFSLRWTGHDCGTGMFTQVKPFKVKATVDENISGFVGGSITNPTNWVYRDYGKPLVYTITPDNGYHISYLKLNGTAVDLINGFDEKGKMTVNTGWTKTQDPNNINDATEDIKLYQRENGVVDVVLPAQYYAVLDTAPARVDHWIDTSFASNGTASSYEITNTLTTSITGGKTWIAGAKAHIDNSELSFNLTRDGKAYQFNPSQMTWNADGTYVLSGLPKYAADGHEYIYVLEENVPAGYDGKKDGNNFINTLKQENITIQGKKTWNDGGRTHNNAADVVITLKRASTTDGVNYGSPETLDLVPVWEGDTYKFSNLPKYDDACFEYRYTVEEKLSDAFLATLAEGETYTSTTDDTGRNFVNTLTGKPKTTFTGTKIWSDGKTHENNDDEITLVLYWESAAISKRNTGLKRGTGEELQKGEYRLEWTGNTFTFSGLPKYDNEGNPYTYSVRESYIKNEQTGNVSTQTKDTDYTVLYDGKVWDFDSYKTEADAYKETAYTTIENRITPLVIRKTVPRQTQNPEKKTVRVRIYVPNTGAEQIGILEREHTFYYLIVCLCLVVMTVSGGYLVYSHRKENR